MNITTNEKSSKCECSVNNNVRRARETTSEQGESAESASTDKETARTRKLVGKASPNVKSKKVG